MVIDEKSKKNILISLVGTNPLPVAALSLYILDKDNFKNVSSLYLLYSEENEGISQVSTKGYAKKIKELISEKGYKDKVSIKLLGIKDIGVPAKIIQDAKELLTDLSINNNYGKIYFNYTGGTKPMSTSIYNWLCDNTNNKVELVYLDARTSSIVYHHKRGEDLRNCVMLNINNIIDLHDYERKKPKNKNNDSEIGDVCKNILGKLKKLIEKGQIDKFIEKQHHLHKAIDDKKPMEESVNEVFKEWEKAEEPLKEVGKKIIDYTNKCRNNNSKHKFLKFLKFLDGRWLEIYVYKVLENVKDNLSKNDKKLLSMERNLKIKVSSNKDFELDIVAVRGYQLFLISCTTSTSMSLCKEKGFEAYFRAKQIGGDEARVILITGLNKKESENKGTEILQKDLRLFTGTRNKSILAIGADELKKDILKRKFREFILEKEG